MRIKFRFLITGMAAFLFIFMNLNAAQARPWGWAKRLPINQYTPQDIEILKRSMAEILNNGKDGVASEWSNPESGHSGSITPLTTTRQNDRTCRKTRFTSFSDKEENVSEFFLCKQADGVWAVEQPVVQ